MEVIVPRAAKRIFSFTQMRNSCCWNMKWVLEEKVLMLQVGIVIILSAPEAF